MSTFSPDDTTPLLIEITPASGVQEVALTPQEMTAKAGVDSTFNVKQVWQKKS